MVDLETLAAQVAELRDLEAIKKVKYRYFRAMTDNDYEALEETLTVRGFCHALPLARFDSDSLRGAPVTRCSTGTGLPVRLTKLGG